VALPMVGNNICSMKNSGSLRCRFAALLLIVASSVLLSAQEKTSGPWVKQSSGTTAGLRGIHAVGGGVAWASGSDGTVLRTEDGGYMWQRCAMPPNAEKLDFRGIWAWDENTAIVMSSGPGDLSRIYKTTDGCSHWTLLFTNPDKDGFWDAMVFENRDYGVVLGDPVSSAFSAFVTDDGGMDWEKDTDPDLRASSKGEGAFAASNSALAFAIRHNENEAASIDATLDAFGTGGPGGASIFVRTSQLVMKDVQDGLGPLPSFGSKWKRVPGPLTAGTASSGVFSIAFRDDKHAIAVGGDYEKPGLSAGTAAWTVDGGQHWTAAERPPHGYRSAVAWDSEAKAWIAAGTNGSDISYDDGKTWTSLDDGNWNALSLPWVVGPQGRIAKLDSGKLLKK
jgi:photosystem II stability/assembly factor-like uncharacterized protein